MLSSSLGRVCRALTHFHTFSKSRLVDPLLLVGSKETGSSENLDLTLDRALWSRDTKCGSTDYKGMVVVQQ